jgi:hypothetical protein
MTEVFNNFGPITLALACGISDTTITVTNASALSTLGNYRLLIDNEFMLATSRTGSVVSVLRAQEGSTAAAHSLGAPVEPIVSAGALNQLRADAGGLQGYLSVVTGVPQTLSPTEQVAGCQTSAGTTAVNMYATPIAGTKALIFDDQNNAANHNIAVNGSGSNVEDPNSPGTFASSIAIKVNSQAVTWAYDGTQWKVVFSNGGAQTGYGVLLVNHSTPGVLSSLAAHASVDTTTGTTSVTAPTVATLPGSGLGWRFYVSDDGGSAGSNTITVSGGGVNIEDPQNAGTFSASVSIKQSWSSYSWYYNGTHWKIFSFDPGSNLPVAIRPLLAGITATQNGSSNPLQVGALVFRPTDFRVGYKAFLRIVLETTGASYQANFDLVDVNNVLGNGAGVEVPGSLLQTVSTTATELTVELNTAGGNLETLSSNILLIGRIWLTTTLAGQSAICMHAGIYVQ